MAKKKSKPPESKAAREKKNLVVIRGYVDWGVWLESYAESKGMPVVVLIDHLLRESAKKDEFAPPPSRY
jgi:hypothetical protein